MVSRTQIEEWILRQRRRLTRPGGVSEQAKEISQEAIRRALENHCQIRDANKIAAWFDQVHRHAKADYFRNAGDELPLNEDEFAEPGQGLEQQIEQNDLLTKVLRAAESLPPQQRLVFLAKRSMNFRQIESTFGIPKSTAEELYQRAKAEVHRMIGLAVLEGSTRDTDNTPLSGIKIIARHVTYRGGKRCHSRQHGIFTLVLLLPGKYTISAESPSHKPWKDFVELKIGLTDSIQITLVPIDKEVSSGVQTCNI